LFFVLFAAHRRCPPPHAPHLSSPPSKKKHKIPDEAIEHLLRTSGCSVTDPHVVRLAGLATQRFIAAVAHDAAQVERRRRAAARGAGSAAAAARGRKGVLTPEDLGEALHEYGINLTKPPYLAGAVAAPPARGGRAGGGGGGGGTGGGARG
jgi:transcription initiation factor TFIID subunit 10